MIEIWYKKHHKLVQNICQLYESDPYKVEDLCQDVWAKVSENYEKFNGNSKITTWLWTVATNVCKNYLRDTQNIQSCEILESELSPYIQDELWIEGETLDELECNYTETPETLIELDDYLGVYEKLTKTEKIIFHLMDYLSDEDIAEECQIKPTTVRVVRRNIKQQFYKIGESN